jgi:hypothetical protein
LEKRYVDILEISETDDEKKGGVTAAAAAVEIRSFS